MGTPIGIQMYNTFSKLSIKGRIKFLSDNQAEKTAATEPAYGYDYPATTSRQTCVTAAKGQTNLQHDTLTLFGITSVLVQ